MNDYLNLARLSVKNALAGLCAPVVFLGVVIGLILMAVSFFLYGLATMLQEYVPQPGVAYLSVGGGVLLLIAAVWNILTWKRRRDMAKLKTHLVESQKEFLDAVNLAAWVQKYPWGATGLAVGVGFAASSQTYLAEMLVPLGRAIAPIVAEMLVAQNASEQH